MSRKFYLLIIMFLSSGMYVTSYTSEKWIDYLATTSLYIMALYGYITWGKDRVNNKNLFYLPVFVIFALLLFSPFVAYFNFHQYYFDTILSERPIFLWIYLIVFYKIRVKQSEILSSLRTISVLCLVYWLISIFFPQTFVIVSDDFIHNLGNRIKETTRLGTYVPGFEFTTIYFLYTFQRFVDSNKNKHFYEATFWAFFVVLYHNRSTLVIVAIAYVYCLLKSKQIRSTYTILIISILLILILPFLSRLFDSMWTNTQNQLSDDSYNRWKAIDVYLINRVYTPLNVLLGNCIPSSSGLYLKELSTNNSIGAICADIGLIATFYYYGIFPIMLLLYWTLQSFKSYMPLFLKLYSLFLWLVPTIHCFMHPSNSNMVYIIYAYLVLYRLSSKSKINDRFVSYYCKLQYIRHYKELFK